MNTSNALREYFKNDLSAEVDDIQDSDSLLERGILDSMAIVKLIAFLEVRFGVAMTDDEFDPENFESFQAIERLIESKKT
jgi:acyl carrier protein